MKRKCHACGKDRKMTKHHILPKRHFKCHITILLCQECHNELEKILPQDKRHYLVYVQYLIKFLIEKMETKDTTVVECNNIIEKILKQIKEYIQTSHK